MKRSLFTLMLLSITSLCFSQIENQRDTIERKQGNAISVDPVPLLIQEVEKVIPDIQSLSTLSEQESIQEKLSLKFAVPVYWDIPYAQPRLGDCNHFRWDYKRFDAFSLSPNSQLFTYSISETFYTMGTYINLGAIYSYHPNEKWQLNGGIYAAKYTMPSFNRGPHMDYGFNGSIGYSINDWLAVRAVGQYSAKGQRNSKQGYLSPMAPQSSYGMIMSLKVNEWFWLEGGVERAYNPMKRKWKNTSVFYPVIDLMKIGK